MVSEGFQNVVCNIHELANSSKTAAGLTFEEVSKDFQPQPKSASISTAEPKSKGSEAPKAIPFCDHERTQNQASTSEVQLSEKPAVAELCFLDRTRGKSVTRQMQSKGHGTKGAAESLLGTALSSERYGEESGSSKLQQSTSVKRSQGHTLKKSDNRLQNGVMNTVAPAQAALKSLTTDGPGFYGEISGPANLMPSLLPEFLRRISQNTQNAGASVTPDMSAKDSESLSSLPSKSKKMSTHRRNSHLDQTQRPLNSPVPDAFCSDYENISSSHYSRGTSPLHSTTNPRDVAGGKGAMASVRIRLSLEPR